MKDRRAGVRSGKCIKHTEGSKMSLTELILSARAYLSSFDYDHYPDSLSEFETACAPYLAGPSEDPEQLVANLARAWEELPKKESKTAAFEIKQVLALFLSPAACRIGGAAREYAGSVCEVWNKKFPRNTYLMGEYDKIMKGFDHNLLGLPLRKSRKGFRLHE